MRRATNSRCSCCAEVYLAYPRPGQLTLFLSLSSRLRAALVLHTLLKHESSRHQNDVCRWLRSLYLQLRQRICFCQSIQTQEHPRTLLCARRCQHIYVLAMTCMNHATPPPRLCSSPNRESGTIRHPASLRRNPCLLLQWHLQPSRKPAS